MTMGIKTSKLDSRCSQEKEFIELVCMNPLMVYFLLSIKLIHVMIVYVFLRLETSNTSHGWMIIV